MRDLGKISLDLICENPENRRITRASAEAMAASLGVQGQLSPVILRPLEGGTYLLQAGHRRRAGALLLGWTHLAAVETTSDDDLLIGLIENGSREDLPPWVLCKSVFELSARYDMPTIADCIGKSRSHADNLRRVWAQLAPDVREVFKAEGMKASITDWIALAGRPPAVQRAIKIDGKKVATPREPGRTRRSARSIRLKMSDLDSDDIRYQTLAWAQGKGPWPTRQK